jgi:small redox-active disulfide protein 2
MEIKILGTGCTKCKNLEQKVKDYIKEKNIEANIVKEENIFEIIKYGVMTTPALVINDKVELKGILPDKEQLEKIISKYVI